MKEIARAAGAAPRLIHYYLESQDQLLQEVLAEAGERCVKEVEQWCAEVTQSQLLTVTFTEPKQRQLSIEGKRGWSYHPRDSPSL